MAAFSAAASSAAAFSAAACCCSAANAAALSAEILSLVAFKLALSEVLPKTPAMTYLDWHFAYHYMANGLAFCLSIAQCAAGPLYSRSINLVAWVACSTLFIASIVHFLWGWCHQPPTIHLKAQKYEVGFWERRLEAFRSFLVSDSRGFRCLTHTPQLRV